MIAKKTSGAGAAPAAQTAPKTQPVVDILEALKKSIATTRKPRCTENSDSTKDARTRDGAAASANNVKCHEG
jgi:non-homologous end joining protein Ku